MKNDPLSISISSFQGSLCVNETDIKKKSVVNRQKLRYLNCVLAKYLVK